MSRVGEAARRLLLAAAAAALLLAVALLLFLLPPVVHLLLDLSSAAAALGSDAETTHRLSDALVFDLLRGGDFSVRYGGEMLLSAAERSHLADVGALMRTILGAGLLGVLLQCGALLRLRSLGGAEATRLRLHIWRSMGDGARLIATAALLAGAALVLSFERTFAFFHSLVFAAGTWTFNPATDRLVRLYPDSFWVVATISFCVTLVALCVAAVLLSHRRCSSQRERDASSAQRPAQGER